jgi:tRNA 2-thiouridine synthesizing protein A
VKTLIKNTCLPDLLREVESSLALSNAVNLQVDARQLSCPLPLLKARQALRNIAVGDSVRVLATDSGSLKDFASFAQLTGQLIESFCMQDNYFCFVIRKQL